MDFTKNEKTLIIELIKKQAQGVYNVGTGKNHSVNEIANLISDNQVNIPPRIGESRITLADNSKLRDTFGWKPTVKLEDWISQQ